MGNMRMLDLFSGIGGFSLAATWAWKEELEIVGFVEIDNLISPERAWNFKQYISGKRKWTYNKILEIGERLGL